MLFSVIQYTRNFSKAHENVKLGIVVFTPTGPVVELTEVPHSKIVLMAVNALINRLKKENPKTISEIQEFNSKEANEVHLSDPSLLNYDHPILSSNVS